MLIINNNECKPPQGFQDSKWNWCFSVTCYVKYLLSRDLYLSLVWVSVRVFFRSCVNCYSSVNAGGNQTDPLVGVTQHCFLWLKAVKDIPFCSFSSMFLGNQAMKIASRNWFDVAKTLVYVFSIKDPLISYSICAQIAQRGYFYSLGNFGSR